MFGVKREEYERVVQATNELRVKLEKLRLENTLLREQIRAILNLPPELSRLYVIIQSRANASIGEIKKDSNSPSANEKVLKNYIKRLLRAGLIEEVGAGKKTRYSVKTPDSSGGPIGRRDDRLISPPVPESTDDLDVLGDPENV